MKLVGKKGLSGALEILVWVMIGLVIAAIAVLPWIVDNWMMPFNNNPEYWRPRYLVTLGVAGVMALLMLWQGQRILHNVNVGTIFSMDTVRRMKVMGAEALLTTVFFVVMLFFGMTKFSVGLVALVFLLAGLLLFVFSELFRQATAYKQENDMTI